MPDLDVSEVNVYHDDAQFASSYPYRASAARIQKEFVVRLLRCRQPVPKIAYTLELIR